MRKWIALSLLLKCLTRRKTVGYKAPMQLRKRILSAGRGNAGSASAAESGTGLSR